VAEDVLGVQVGVLEGDGGDEVDEAPEIRRVNLELVEVLLRTPLSFGFSFSTASSASSMSLPVEVIL